MINIKRISNGLQLIGQNTSAPSLAGEMRFNSSTNLIELYDTALRSIVTDTGTITLTNKTISGSSNTLTNIPSSAFAAMGSYTVKANFTGSSATPTDVSLGTVTETGSSVLTLTGWSHSVVGTSPTIQVSQATTSTAGYLSSTDWNTFNNKQAAGNYITALTGDVTATGPGSVAATIAANAVTNAKMATMAAHTVKANTSGATSTPTDAALGTVTESTSSVLTLTGWANATIGSPTIQVAQASGSTSGYLSSADWTTFNNKQSALTFGNLTESTSSVLTITGGTGAVIGSGTSIQVKTFGTSQAGVVPASGGGTANFLRADGTWTTPGGGGTVTSVTFTGDGTVLSSTPSSAVTSSGTLTATLNTQTANRILAGPISGAAAAPTFRALTPADMISHNNMLINGAFDFWQRGTSFTVTNGTSVYGPDRWFLTNNSGANCTLAQGGIGVDGSKYSAVATFGASNTSNSMSLNQIIENNDMLQAYNKSVSFSTYITAQGNITQVKVEVLYATTESKTQTTLGNALVTVNSSSPTLCTVNNISIGTNPTTSGSISVRISCTAASSGNIYASGNGFAVEQAMLNVGATTAPFRRAGNSISEELALCQRFYEKSFALSTTPAGNVGQSTCEMFYGMYTTTTSFRSNSAIYRVNKRATPTVTFYSPGSANSGSWDYLAISSGAYTSNEPVSIESQHDTRGFNVTGSGLASGTIGTNNILLYGHWTADAEI